MTKCTRYGILMFTLAVFLYAYVSVDESDMMALFKESVSFLGTCIYIAGFMAGGKND